MKIVRTAALLAAASAAYNAAKDYARENPDKASDTIDKAESFVRGKAGPKYADKVGKGSSALRQSLGLPKRTAAPTTRSTTTSSTTTSTTTSPSASTTTPAAAGEASSSAPADFDPVI